MIEARNRVSVNQWRAGVQQYSSMESFCDFFNSGRRSRLTSLDYHQSIPHWSVDEVTRYLCCRDGYVSVVVATKNGDPNIVEACLYKAMAEMKLGISFQNDEEGLLHVLKVAGDGLLGEQSVLQAGDYVESINGNLVQFIDATSAAGLATRLNGMVSLRTKKANTAEVSLQDFMMFGETNLEFGNDAVVVADKWDVILESGDIVCDNEGYFLDCRFISVAIHKPTVETRFGISFANPMGKELIILSISDQSLLRKTPLKAGCIVHLINDIPTLLYTHAMAMVFKPTPRSALGLAFQSTGECLSLSSRIASDGLFVNSVLNEGDQVIAIKQQDTL